MDLLDSSTFFAPRAHAPKGKKLLKTTLVGKTTVYIFPKDLTEEELLSIGLLLALTGTNTTAALAEWKSYICTYSCFLIPELQGALKKESYTLVNVSKANIAASLSTVKQYLDVAQEEEANNKVSDTGLAKIKLHNGLPSIDAESGYKWVGAEATAKHIYAHYAMLVFLAGKTVTDLNRDAVTVNRPAALIGKFHLDEETMLLNGNLRISDVGHTLANVAWGEMTSFRAACFSEFIKYASVDVDLGQDIIYTNVHLMRYANMGHAKLSYKLIRANPWVLDFAPLASSIAVFMDSVRVSMTVAPSLQPYVKLMYGDKSGLFPRKEMEPLVACAAALEEEVSETVTNFVRSDKYAAIVDLFLEERRMRMAKKRTARVATLAEIEEADEADATNPDLDEDDDGTEAVYTGEGPVSQGMTLNTE